MGWAGQGKGGEGTGLTGALRARSGSSCARRATCRESASLHGAPVDGAEIKLGLGVRDGGQPPAVDPLLPCLAGHYAAATAAAAAAGGRAHRIRRGGDRRRPVGRGRRRREAGIGGRAPLFASFLFCLFSFSRRTSSGWVSLSFPPPGCLVQSPLLSPRWPWPVHLYVLEGCVFLFGFRVRQPGSCYRARVRASVYNVVRLIATDFYNICHVIGELAEIMSPLISFWKGKVDMDLSSADEIMFARFWRRLFQNKVLEKARDWDLGLTIFDSKLEQLSVTDFEFPTFQK